MIEIIELIDKIARKSTLSKKDIDKISRKIKRETFEDLNKTDQFISKED